jgi:Sulfotransferase domain
MSSLFTAEGEEKHMSTNAALQPTQHLARNRSLATKVKRKTLDYLTSAVGYVIRFIDWESRKLAYKGYAPRPDDIFVVTFPKSGTTWMQMILYQIFTDGEMDLAHISEWSPNFDNCVRGRGIDHLPSPRIIKSHLAYNMIPKGPCKYIYVVRNGKDVAVSYFHFARTHLNFNGDFGQFLDLFLNGFPSGVYDHPIWIEYGHPTWFEHVGQWLENRQNLDMLFLTYEELKRDREGAVRKILAFCGKEVSPEKFARIVERSSFAFMKQHEDKLDTLTWRLMEDKMKTGNFIRKGEVGGWKECFSSEQEKLFQRRFTKHLNNLNTELKNIIK